MEQFLDATTHKPLATITLAEGETRIVAVKKFALGKPPSVVVLTRKPSVAICHQVSHLLDPTKLKYDTDRAAKWSSIGSFGDELVTVERNGLYFFQIAGQTAGTTELSAAFTKSGQGDYAATLPVTVTPTKNTPIMIAPASFNTIWANHPMNHGYPGQNGESLNKPCDQAKWLVGQCMVRFCTALNRSGATLTGLHGNRCGIAGKGHAHHFVNPYDFSTWQHTKPHFVWEAKPLQPEPMPGIAAFWYMMQKQGVVVFWNYFPTVHDHGKGKDMFGGHIDFWNKVRMGNTYNHQNPYDGESAFMRARKIEFWLMN